MPVSLFLKKSKVEVLASPVTSNHTKEIPKSASLCTHHYEELVKSGIDAGLIELNWRSLVTSADIAKFLNWESLTDWQRKSTHSKVLNNAAWVCGSQLKSDEPRTTGRRNKKKVIKYENPVGSSSNPIYLDVPTAITAKIAEKYGVAYTPGEDFWMWVKSNPSIPIVVVEGVKKAGCVITNALTPAIALPGHTTACLEDKTDVRFAEFLHPSRVVTLALDNDAKISAVIAVERTITNIRFKINPDKHTSRAILRVAQWYTLEKGIDDIFETQGAEGVVRVLSEAVHINEWVPQSYNKLGYAADVQFNSKKWQKVEIPESKEFVNLKGAKGTGKTKQIEWLVDEVKETCAKTPIIAITPRIELAKNLAQRLKITHIDELTEIGSTSQIALCINSILKIDPEKFKGALVVIDEANQLANDFILGDLCRKNRQKLVKHLRQILLSAIDNGGRLVIADADLNYNTINFFKGLLGVVTPFIIENTYNEPSYKCYLSKGFDTQMGNLVQKSPADVLALIVALAVAGKRLIVHTTGRAEESKSGSLNIEKLLLTNGVTSIIRIDSHSTKDPNHPAFKAGSNINQICDNYQVVIATQTIGTGVSIENHLKFDYVFGIATGVGTPDAVRQSLIRLRDINVPRILYVAEVGLNTNYKNLGYTPEQVRKNSKDNIDYDFDILTEIDSQWCEEYPEILANELVTTFTENAIADTNVKNNKFRAAVKSGLKSENVELIEVETVEKLFPDYTLDPQKTYEDLKVISELGIAELRQKIAERELISKEKLEQLSGASELSEAEQLDKKKAVLDKKYGGIEVTEVLIAKDDGGWYDQIKLHYSATCGSEIQQKIHCSMGNSQLKMGEGEIIQIDFINRQKTLAQVELLNQLGVLEFIESNPIISKIDESSIELYETIIGNYADINKICNTSFRPDEAGTDFNLNKIKDVLGLMGVKVEFIGQPRIAGKQIRQYQIAVPADGRNEVFERWLVRDDQSAQLWEARKRDWEIRKLVSTVNSEMSIADYCQLETNDLFPDVWERVNTRTRAEIINKVDGVQYIPSHKIFIDATNSTAITEAFTKINSMPAVAIDSETYGNDKPNKKGMRKEGLHKVNGHIRLIQFSDATQTFTFDFGDRDSNTRQLALDTFKPHFNALLARKDITVVGHNLSFDNGFWKHTFHTEANCQFSDTLLGFKVFFGIYNGDNFGKGGFSLGSMVEQFLGIPMDKTEQKSDWGGTLTKSQIDYAALDPHLNFLLWKRLKEIYDDPTKFGFAKLAKWNMNEAWKLENDCIDPLNEIEFNGLPISQNAVNDLIEKVDDETTQLLAKWCELVPGVDKPTKGKQLLKHLEKKYSLVLESCDKKTLGNHIELVEIKLRFLYMSLLNHRTRLTKLAKSIERNGRAKTFFNPLTGTGRTSSGGQFDDIVNVQSIPAKESKEFEALGIPSLRTAFVVDDGLKLIVSDMAAAHARIANDFANDAIGKLAQNDDSIDAHSVFALLIAQSMPLKFLELGLPARFLLNHELKLKIDWDKLQIDYQANKQSFVDLVECESLGKYLLDDVTVEDKALLQDFKDTCDSSKICKALRGLSKNIFYAKLNGASIGRIKAELAGQMKIVATDSEAKSANDRFDALYPQLAEYCKNVVKTTQDDQNQIRINNKIFGISEIAQTGQRLLFNLVEKDGELKVPATAIIAAQWSRTEATIMKRSLVLISKIIRKHPEWNAKLVNIIHDELNIEVLKKHAPKVAKLVCWVMDREFKKELKNGVTTGSPNFKNNHSEKYLLDENGEVILDHEGEKKKDKRFKSSYHSLICDCWADK